MINQDKIQRVTSRGQITLPISWRRKMGTKNTIIIRTKEDSLEILPFHSEDARDDAWVTVFDAVRDTKGKGIPAKKLSQMIRRART
jgi:AbrB family looped-hinge helix DNA binding protein